MPGIIKSERGVNNLRSATPKRYEVEMVSSIATIFWILGDPALGLRDIRLGIACRTSAKAFLFCLHSLNCLRYSLRFVSAYTPLIRG
jgi:hypothetical protein